MCSNIFGDAAELPHRPLTRSIEIRGDVVHVLCHVCGEIMEPPIQEALVEPHERLGLQWMAVTVDRAIMSGARCPNEHTIRSAPSWAQFTSTAIGVEG